MMIRIR